MRSAALAPGCSSADLRAPYPRAAAPAPQTANRMAKIGPRDLSANYPTDRDVADDMAWPKPHLTGERRSTHGKSRRVQL